MPALVDAGMKEVRRRERDVSANGWCQQMGRMIIGSRSNPGTGGRSAWCGAARKDLDNDHAPAAARTRRAMIGRGVRIGCVVRCWRIDLRYWAAISSLARAMLVLQLALASSP